MSKYHAGKPGAPLCGTRGHGNRYNVVVLGAKEWNALAATQRCEKCIAKIREAKRKY